MKTQLEQAVIKNINWFLNSGIMRPNDGFWGVAERLVLLSDNDAKDKINEMFPCQTSLSSDVSVIEHRRPDCTMQVALMFDLAGEYFDNNDYKIIARNLIDFILNRSGLLHDGKEGGIDPEFDIEKDKKLAGLWGWAVPNSKNICWSDDNSWIIIIFLILAKRGYPELREYALNSAKNMKQQIEAFLLFVENNGRNTQPEKYPMYGIQLNPHWLGLATLAMAHAHKADSEIECTELMERYYNTVLLGAPEYDHYSFDCRRLGLPWSFSEYTYLSYIASAVGKEFNNPSILKVAESATNILLKHQFDDGHFPSDHYEAPSGKNLADIIYTQNWATLGLQHAAQCFPEKIEYQNSFVKSLEFLMNIQDKSNDPVFRGCWRGMYDCDTKDWGGGDSHEGGAGSIYSGWTNAPISLSILFELMNKSLFTDSA